MADESNRIGSSSGGADLLRPVLGGGKVGQREVVGAGGASASGGQRGPMGGPRGNRILPADYPLDQLDRRAARGTYLDILV